jgi:hypothetical protein
MKKRADHLQDTLDHLTKTTDWASNREVALGPRFFCLLS